MAMGRVSPTFAVGVWERTPKALASYEQVDTTSGWVSTDNPELFSPLRMVPLFLDAKNASHIYVVNFPHRFPSLSTLCFLLSYRFLWKIKRNAHWHSAWVYCLLWMLFAQIANDFATTIPLVMANIPICDSCSLDDSCIHSSELNLFVF